jgi:ketosteroid isomerase-like protein
MNSAFIVPVLSLCIGVGVALADAPIPSTDQAAVNAVKQVEEDMGYAMIQRDMNKLSEFYADDFATLTKSGKVITKKDLLSDFESFHDKLESFENGPVDVQVFGTHAVAHAAVVEKRFRDGKDVSGVFVWSDLLEFRGGKWVVVRSAGARVK